MRKLDITVEVDEPSEWVNSLVIVAKTDGRLHICQGPHDLIKVIKREYFPMPTVKTVKSEMSGAKYSSKLNASNGYWQIKIDEQSSRLLAFNTLFGRYRFKYLLFGILSSSEAF